MAGHLRLAPGMGGRIRAFVIVAAAYYLGAQLGLSMALVGRNVTPFWPPTGIAVAAFLLVGRRLWPAVALAAFVVNLPITPGPVPAALTAAGNTLAPIVAVTLLHRVGFRRELDRQRDALAIVFLGALASMLVSATIGTGTLALFSQIPTTRIVATWAVWWTGDTIGVLAVTPFLLSIPLFWEHAPWTWKRWVEAAVILVAVTAATAYATQSLRVLFLALPVVGWAAWRLRLRGAAPAALIASGIATWSATRAAGPFEDQTILGQMLTLLAFNASVALTSFFLAALVSERAAAADALAEAAAELEERVRLRTAELTTVNARLRAEMEGRSQAQLLLTREEERSRREHEIAETLQRSLLPDPIIGMPGVSVAARYVPATSDMQVGGDWYDVVQLQGGLIGLAIGDVAGHGLPAAAMMAQLRMALRAYAVQDPSPSSVLRHVQRLVTHLPVPEMVTLMYVVIDPSSRLLRFTNAGHPPGLVVGPDHATYLHGGLTPPLGVTRDTALSEATHQLKPGDTLVLYTDGLIERRGESIRDGLERLQREALARAGDGLEDLCDELVGALVEAGKVPDDVAIIALRPVPLVGGPLTVTLPAEARMLAQIRIALRRWLSESEVCPDDEGEILVACGEACANVVQHAYSTVPGDIIVEGHLDEGVLELTVRDRGSWRPVVDRGGGWGLKLIDALMDSVDVQQQSGGTVVRMRRQVRTGGET